MTSSVTLLAPAKINLSLRILGKRSDGYHDLETLMVPLSLADEVEISHAHHASQGTILLTCNDPSLPTDKTNLCVAAALAFQEATGLDEAITITLLKKIPHGAGLGGGSSNAAAVLRGLNLFFEEPLVLEELLELAASLGSDVPFFIEGKPAWCHGRGELLSAAPEIPEASFLLLKPPFSIATPWAYQQWDKNTAVTYQDPPHYLGEVALINDLEGPVFKKYLLLPVLKSWLQQRAEVEAAWMSGSGSTMVALLKKNLSREEKTSLKKEALLHFGDSLWTHEATFFKAKEDSRRSSF